MTSPASSDGFGAAAPRAAAAASIDPRDITGLVLAGGLGGRMGGVDKGLQMFCGLPLAQRAVARLGCQVGPVAISANRHLDRYRAMGVPVWPDDALPGFAGPLAGFIAGLAHCTTPFLVTVPCDSPLFPADLVDRLGQALVTNAADVVIASAGESGSPRSQPTFCLMRTGVLPGLQRYTADGGRKIQSWARQQRFTEVVFEEAAAFVNLNTLDELARLQSTSGRA